MNSVSRPLAFFVAITFASSLLAPLGAKPKTEPGPSSSAIVGFRSADSEYEGAIREGLLKKLSGKRLKLIPDEVTEKYVESVWTQETAEALSIIELAYRRYLRGKDYYEKLKLNEALEELNKAVRGYREGIVALRDNRYLLAAHLYLGMALIVLNRVPEGKKFIREMVVLDASREKRELPAREFPPRIVKIHKLITKGVLKGPKGKLLITTDPPESTVVFDGVVQGQAPLELDNVPVGEHFLVVEKRGRRQHSKRVLVKAGTKKVLVKMDEWRPFAPYAFSRRQDVDAHDLLGRVARQLGAKVLVLGTSTHDKKRAAVTAQLYDPQTRSFSKIERVDTSTSVRRGRSAGKKLGKRLLKQLSSDGTVVAELIPPKELFDQEDVPIPGSDPMARKAPTALYKKWWFWAAVGGAVATGVGLALVMGSSDADYNVLEVPNPLAP